MSYFLSMKNLTKKNRREIIKIVEDFINNNDFEHYYQRWYNSSNSEVNKEDVKKIYNPLGYMTKVINEFLILTPSLKNFTTLDKDKINILKRTLRENNWEELLLNIFKNLETKGDFFAYWYYPENSTIPKIKVLKPENMVDGIMNSNGEVEVYVYEEYVSKKKFDKNTNTIITEPPVLKKIIFEKGKITVIDDNGTQVFPNKPFETDIMRLIHIPSFRDAGEVFSEIPASKYLDLILLLNAISTDIRYINRLLGFPIVWLFDGEIDWDKSSIIPGGKIDITTKERDDDIKAQSKIQVQEISNNLKTITEERDLAESFLYKLAGLIREKLEEKLGSSDSAKVASQLRLPLENKNKKYCENIAQYLTPFFTSVLKANNLYDEKEVVTLAMPDQFVNGGIFDELIIKNTKLAMGDTTLREEWRKEGLTEEQIELKIKELNEEKLNGNKDISVSKETSPIDIDNKFKTK